MLLYDRLLQVLKAQKEEYMLVYDANANSGSNAGFECTYTTFKSDNPTASPENPILVLDNSESGDPYKLVVYNISGQHIFDTTFGIQYTDMQFDGKSVVISNASTFVLLNMSGKKLADISFDMPVINVLPTGARGSYTIVNSKYIQSIKLK